MRSTRDGLLCPHRVIDDIGSGFSLGTIMGSFWYFLKGAWHAPKQKKFSGGIDLLKRRAFLIGGGFATWMGLFGLFQCILVDITENDTHLNQVIAGAFAGGIINVRGGYKHIMRGMINGGVLIGVFNIFEIVMMKYQIKNEYRQRHLMVQKQNLDQISHYIAVRPGMLIRFSFLH